MEVKDREKGEIKEEKVDGQSDETKGEIQLSLNNYVYNKFQLLVKIF